MRLKITLIVCLYASSVVAAQQTSTTNSTTVSNNTAFEQSRMTAYKQFHLTKNDWQRYQSLKEGPAGYYNPNMNPVVMLGIYAQNPQEQQRLAKIAAKNNHEYAEKTLDFQRAYQAAFNELYPDAKVFDFEGDQATGAALLYQPSPLDNLVLFVKIDDCPACIARYQQLMQTGGIKLNIHFDTSDENAIFAWAKAQQVPSALVQSRQITLNKKSRLDSDWGIHQYPTLLKKSPTDSQYQVVP